MPEKQKINIFWFRRDLRLEDNCGLSEALKSGLKVLPVFIYDTGILNKLENKSDKRVDYFHRALKGMHAELKKHKSGLTTFQDTPMEVFRKLTKDFEIDTVFCNEDYEPEAIKRDKEVAGFLEKKNIQLKSFKDQVVFHKDDVTKKRR